MGRSPADRLVNDALERSDREQEFQDWLGGMGLEDSWQIAPILVDSGWDRPRLEGALAGHSPEEAGVLLRWLAGSHAVGQLLGEVAQSAERISEIVLAVKSYSYLDQAPVQEVDIHRGLEETLVILRHKLASGVVVHREYDQALPRIGAYGSELNQVWTNILDNAIDAMDGKGEIRIRTYAAEGHVIVEITDNGPGIPEAVQPRIFDPFFTTKPPGVGTGLGLHISYNIVVQKHQGQIHVSSRPGETRFQISLPIRLESPPA
jgi:signal transduction histidine kinase